ncbi:MAG: hypothetical protein KAI66_25405, partial [Lentisphaeria bacterium]|nr:hypothetical protein [Lentisphaeria bacterium]
GPDRSQPSQPLESLKVRNATRPSNRTSNSDEASVSEMLSTLRSREDRRPWCGHGRGREAMLLPMVPAGQYDSALREVLPRAWGGQPNSVSRPSAVDLVVVTWQHTTAP